MTGAFASDASPPGRERGGGERGGSDGSGGVSPPGSGSEAWGRLAPDVAGTQGGCFILGPGSLLTGAFTGRCHGIWYRESLLRVTGTQDGCEADC